MKTNSAGRSLEAPMTLLALAFSLALAAGACRLAGTEPLISVTGEVMTAGQSSGPERLVRAVR